MFAYIAILALAPSGDGRGDITCLRNDDLRPNCIQFSSDGRTLAVAGGTKKGCPFKIFHLATGKTVLDGMDFKERCTPAWAVCLSQDGTLMAVGGTQGLFIVDTKTRKPIWNLTGEGHEGSIDDLFFTPDNKHLISSASDGTVRFWDIQKKKPVAVFGFNSRQAMSLETDRAPRAHKFEGYYGGNMPCALAPDGKTVAIGGNFHSEIPFVEIATGKVPKTLKIKQDRASSLLFTPDGKWLVVGGSDRNARVEIWDVEKKILVNSFGDHEDSILHVAISPDKKTVITGGSEDGFRVWDVATGKQKYSYFSAGDPRMPRVTLDVFPDSKPFFQKAARSSGVAFLPDGKTFVVVPHWTHGKTEVYFHDTATGKAVDFRDVAKRLPAEKK
jgi:WD40 repeat protein